MIRKNQYITKFSIILLIGFCLLVQFISIFNFDLYPSVPDHFNFRIPLGICCGFQSLLVILIFGGSVKRFLHIFWIIPLLYLVNFYFTSSKNYEDLDFFFSPKKDFVVHQIRDNEFWLTHQIIIEGKDTIYYSQHKDWDKWWTAKDLQNLEVRKSLTNSHYHLRMKGN